MQVIPVSLWSEISEVTIIERSKNSLFYVEFIYLF